jgi:MerR family copper efflux transcriptional regulator
LKVNPMRIGELAAQAGVSTSKIRFYEARGLLPPAARLVNGYRNYDDRALLTVRFIDRAQKLGFSLAEVGGHLSLPKHVDRKASLRARLEVKLEELDAHMRAVRKRRAFRALR